VYRLWHGVTPVACRRRYPTEHWKCYFAYRLYTSLESQFPLLTFSVKVEQAVAHFYSALTESDSPQMARVLHVLTRDHTVLPATRTCVRVMPASPAAERHRTLAGTRFPLRVGG